MGVKIAKRATAPSPIAILPEKLWAVFYPDIETMLLII